MMHYRAQETMCAGIVCIAFLALAIGGVELQCVRAASHGPDHAKPCQDVQPPRVIQSKEDRQRFGEEALNAWIDAHKACSGVTAEDIEALHKRLDAGETITWHVRFELGSNGRVNKVQVVRGSGLESIERSLSPEVCGLFVYNEPLSRGFQTLKDMGADVAISKRSLQFRLFGQGATVEEAEQVERLEKAEWAERIGKAKYPGQRQYLELYQLGRNGREVSLSADLDWYSVRMNF